VLIIVSVWTIDLARIMSHYGVRHLLCTITLGVDATYSGKVWWQQTWHLFTHNYRYFEYWTKLHL